jgi:hypothetical protein
LTTQWPKEKGQRTNNDLQNTTQKTKNRVTRTPLNTGGKLKWKKTTVPKSNGKIKPVAHKPVNKVDNVLLKELCR